MPNKNEKDDKGVRYGMLVGVRKVGSRNGAVWLYRCDCGNEKAILAKSVRSGATRSCGCKKGNKGMTFHKDLTGNRYGKLVVLKDIGCTGKNNRIMFAVRCDCGNEFNVRNYLLTEKKITMCQSCANSTHGLSQSKLYRKWQGMKARCLRTNHPAFPDYGGRGITICEEWLEFMTFAEWAYDNGYKEVENGWDYSIDRIDVNGNYCPQNCRLANKKRQMRNRRCTRYVEYEGEKMCVEDAAEVCGISASKIRNRLRRGWNDYDATHTKNARGSNGSKLIRD